MTKYITCLTHHLRVTIVQCVNVLRHRSSEWVVRAADLPVTLGIRSEEWKLGYPQKMRCFWEHEGF